MQRLDMSQNPLAEAADPACQVLSNGTIEWANEAFHLLCGSVPHNKPSLEQFVMGLSVAQLKEIEQFTMTQIHLQSSSGDLVPLTALTLPLTGVDLDEERFLIIFTSVAPSNSGGLRDKTEFFATVAHDIKNPLGAIFGYADALLDTPAGEGISEKQREIVSRMRNTASRAIDLVRNYQHLAEYQAGRFMAAPTAYSDLNEVVRSVVDTTWREDRSTVTLSVDLCEGEVMARAERIHLDRIVSNLFSNALKYTPLGGSISLKTELEGNSAVFHISNSGPAISAHELPLIFDRYKRASTSGGTSGSGLGLFIVRFVLEGLGGTITVKSEEPTGTEFTVRIPIAD